MTASFDIEFVNGDIFHDFIQVESDYSLKAIQLLTEDGDIRSIAVRDEAGRLLRIFDFRDASSCGGCGHPYMNCVC